MKKIVVAIVMLVFVAAGAKAETDTLEVVTSAVCGMCKDKIENNMNFEKGVKYVELDLDTKVCTILYNPNKTTPETLREAITLLGYDADDVVADSEAYDDLPGCCKKGSTCDD